MLVIHEEAKDGRIVADLLAPVEAVSAAVGNLVAVSLSLSLSLSSVISTCKFLSVECALVLKRVTDY